MTVSFAIAVLVSASLALALATATWFFLILSPFLIPLLGAAGVAFLLIAAQRVHKPAQEDEIVRLAA